LDDRNAQSEDAKQRRSRSWWSRSWVFNGTLLAAVWIATYLLTASFLGATLFTLLALVFALGGSIDS